MAENKKKAGSEGLQEIVCKACGAPVPIGIDDIDHVTCPYCGTVLVLSEEAAELNRMLRVRSEARRRDQAADLEYLKKKNALDGGGRMPAAADKARLARREIFARIGLIAFAFWCLILGAALLDDSPGASAVAFVQMVLAILALALKKKLIGSGKKRVYTALLAVMWLLTIAFIGAGVASEGSGSYVQGEETWPHGTLASLLPDPDSQHCYVVVNSSDSFYVHVRQYSEDSFAAYVEACKEKGFTIEAVSSDDGYSAFNSDGSKLDLDYYDSEMTVNLDAPMKFTKVAWPAYVLDGRIPVPASDQGNVSWENNSGFQIYIGNTTKDDYNSYIEACLKAGFDQDYSRGDGYFYGDDTSGNHLRVSYEGFNIMEVYFSYANK